MAMMAFRAEKDAVHWAVVDGTLSAPILIVHDRLRIPEDLSIVKGLIWLRARVHSMLDQHRPDAVAMHLVEASPDRSPMPKAIENLIRRARLEGMLLEATRPRQVVATSDSSGRGKHASGRFTKRGFINVDGSPFDWREVRSTSRRQAIVAAASMLPNVAGSPPPDS